MKYKSVRRLYCITLMIPALLGCANNSSTTLTAEIHPPTETATSFGLDTSENCTPTLDPDACINEETIRETGGAIRNNETDLIDIAGVVVVVGGIAPLILASGIFSIAVCTLLLPVEQLLDDDDCARFLTFRTED